MSIPAVVSLDVSLVTDTPCARRESFRPSFRQLHSFSFPFIRLPLICWVFIAPCFFFNPTYNAHLYLDTVRRSSSSAGLLAHACELFFPLFQRPDTCARPVAFSHPTDFFYHCRLEFGTIVQLDFQRRHRLSLSSVLLSCFQLVCVARFDAATFSRDWRLPRSRAMSFELRVDKVCILQV